MADHEKAYTSKTVAYTTGFVLSLVLTIAAYSIVTIPLLRDDARILAIAALAVVQLYVQLIFFLHLASEKRPRWNLRVFAFMLVIVGIVVIGSLWIMKNLDYHSMTPEETETYILKDEGIKP